MQNANNIRSSGSSFESERHKVVVSDAEEDTLLSGDASQQIYLAQVGIWWLLENWFLPSMCATFSCLMLLTARCKLRGFAVKQLFNLKFIYFLFQVPIMNTEDQERVQLETLREDIQMVCACLSRFFTSLLLTLIKSLLLLFFNNFFLLLFNLCSLHFWIQKN